MSADTSELYNGNFESPDPRFSEVFKNGLKGNMSVTFQNKDIMKITWLWKCMMSLGWKKKQSMGVKKLIHDGGIILELYKK